MKKNLSTFRMFFTKISIVTQVMPQKNIYVNAS